MSFHSATKLQCDVLIVGAGFAGASSAWHLSKDRDLKIILIEQEETAAVHSSGLNASLLRQFEEDPRDEPQVLEAESFLLNPPKEWGEIISQTGSLMLFKNTRIESVEKNRKFYSSLGLATEMITKKEAIAKVPILEGADFDAAVLTPTDGTININKLIWCYLNDAKHNGVTIRFKEALVDIKVTDGGNFLVTTEKDTIEAKYLVNATGAWIGFVGKKAGASDIEFMPLRRHLFVTKPVEGVDPLWPFVWHIDHQFYFRPESGGLLLGPCDEELVPAGPASTSFSGREMLAEKISKYFPSLLNVEISHEWAGIRTFTKDRSFLIGPDAKLPNFIWAGALGGSGVCASWLVGKLVKDAIR